MFTAEDISSDKFWSRVNIGSHKDCWNWRGFISDSGYGVFSYAKSKRARAHRIAFAKTVSPIPNDKVVCHTCDNPRCCNPSHLWLGTVAENNADRERKGRTVSPFGNGFNKTPKGEKHGSAKLTERVVKIIRESDMTGADISRALGISQSTVSRIRSGKLWATTNHNQGCAKGARE